MPFIDDEELRELYASECEEHLQAMDEGLLRLEKAPQDSATLEAVFRAAHSIKGSSRMVGVSGAEAISHHLEEVLNGAKYGRTVLSSSDMDRLSFGLNALKKFVNEAVRGVPCQLNITQVLAEITQVAPPNPNVATSSTRSIHQDDNAPKQTLLNAVSPVAFPANVDSISSVVAPTNVAPIKGAFTGTEPVRAPQAADTPTLETRELAPPISAALSSLAVREEDVRVNGFEQKNENSGEKSEDFKIQTMRVPPARLDALMTLASELAVTTTRVSRGLSSLDEIGNLCERWSRDLSQRQRQFTRLAKQNGAAVSARERAALYEEEVRMLQLQQLWRSFRDVVPKNAVRLSAVAEDIETGIRNVRLLPLATVFALFPRLVRDLAREQGKEIDFRLDGGDTPADKRVLEAIKDPLMHMLRNAIDHGIETPEQRAKTGKTRRATLHLRASRGAAGIVIELSDDGRGLDEDAIANVALRRGLHTAEELESMSREQVQMLIFAPNFSTSAIVTDVSGRGVGMDVVRHNIEKLKGTLATHSVRGGGCLFTIRLPLTLATTRVLLVKSNAQTFALPVESVQKLVRLRHQQIFSTAGRATWIENDEAVPLFSLAQLLKLTPNRAASTTSSTRNDAILCVIVSVDGEKIGLEVEAFLDEQDVVFKAMGALLRRVPNVAGTTILGNGEVCVVLNAHDLLRSSRHERNNSASPISSEISAAQTARAPKTILLVEDSITTRTLEKRILESAGYEVVTAVDGADGLTKLASRAFDAVVSDVEMPNLNGLSMAAKIRENSALREMPIILVTSLASDEDKKRGVEVGADAYITKGAFEQKALLDALARLV